MGALVETKEATMEPNLIEHIFTYHQPTPDQVKTYDLIRLEFLDVAYYLNAVLPEGPGKTVAIRKLADARMAANAALALGGRF